MAKKWFSEIGSQIGVNTQVITCFAVWQKCCVRTCLFKVFMQSRMLQSHTSVWVVVFYTCCQWYNYNVQQSSLIPPILLPWLMPFACQFWTVFLLKFSYAARLLKVQSVMWAQTTPCHSLPCTPKHWLWGQSCNRSPASTLVVYYISENALEIVDQHDYLGVRLHSSIYDVVLPYTIED